MTDLQLLAMQRAIELGEEVFRAHQDLTRWRPTAEMLNDLQKNNLSIKLQGAIEMQRRILDAIIEDHESRSK